MKRCYLGLGSNLRTPPRQLRKAIEVLQKIPRSVITKISQIYPSRAMGGRSQPTFNNMVVEIYSSLSATQLLAHCERIEHLFKRTRKKHWGARTLDIDLLLYGQCKINHPNLSVPHPEMLNRDFVLVPLLEISPNVELPSGEPLNRFLSQCQPYVKNKSVVL